MTDGPARADDDPAVAPDTVVRTALQLLPVPPHEDDFWARLEAALAAEPPHVAPSEPVRRVIVADPLVAKAEAEAPVAGVELDPALAMVPAAFRRPSNAVLALVAAAAVVVVAIAGNLLLEERNGTTVSGPRADAALETLVRSAQADDGTVTTLSATREEDSSEAVLAWVDDLGAGDAESAWDAMGSTSQAHFGSQSEFESVMGELAEGYGAWAAATPDDVLVMPVASADGSTVAVVTLVGTVEREGTSQVGAEAFPVLIADGDVVVEPFASAGALEVVIPEPASEDALGWEPVGTEEELVFVLPGSAEAPVLQIDGGDTVICGQAPGSEFGELDQSDGQRCAYLPDGGFSAGDHTVTIAFRGPDGRSITAEAIRFRAA
jgi:hypothetical protein